jgi:hypothetical protein
MQFTTCPEASCGALAEIIDRWVFASTDGPIEHVKVQCLHRHWFLMPAGSLRSATAPATAQVPAQVPVREAPQRRSG